MSTARNLAIKNFITAGVCIQYAKTIPLQGIGKIYTSTIYFICIKTLPLLLIQEQNSTLVLV